MNINLHIEQLILTGANLNSHQKNELKETITLALKQQLEIHGADSIVRSNKNPSPVKRRGAAISDIQQVSHLGQQIGNAIYRGIKQ